jgi:forkhead box protein K
VRLRDTFGRCRLAPLPPQAKTAVLPSRAIASLVLAKYSCPSQDTEHLPSMSPSVASPSNTHNLLPPFAADDPHDAPAKISAYYSLVFPNITFYLQTLTVTIGRRCIPLASNSVTGADGVTSTQSPVDVDLGPLKSVSRLHAKIEYEEEEERFVLVVIGRNGAWVDGVWSGASSRVPLSERCVR